MNLFLILPFAMCYKHLSGVISMKGACNVIGHLEGRRDQWDGQQHIADRYRSLRHRRSQGGPKGPRAPKFLAYFIVSCFEGRCPKQNTVARLKSIYFALRKILGLQSHFTIGNHQDVALKTTIRITGPELILTPIKTGYLHWLICPILMSMFFKKLSTLNYVKLDTG